MFIFVLVKSKVMMSIVILGCNLIIKKEIDVVIRLICMVVVKGSNCRSFFIIKVDVFIEMLKVVIV